MLSPSDIQSKEFEIKMRGYDRDQVDDFLDEIIKDISLMYKDNAELIEKLQKTEEELSSLKAKYDEEEKTRDLLRYQCEELKKRSAEEYENIIARAKAEAQNILKGINDNKTKMKELCSNIIEMIDRED